MIKSMLALCVLATLVPVYVDPALFAPFGTAKAFFARTVLLLLAPLLAFRLFRHPSEEPETRHSVLLLLMGFTAYSLCATLFSPDRARSFFGSLGALGGSLQDLLLVIFVMSLVVVDRARPGALHVFSGILVATTAVAVTYGLLGRAGLSLPLIDPRTPRVAGLLGSPTVLAGLCVVVFFLGLGWWQAAEHASWRRLVGILLAFVLLGILASGTRGGIAGLAAGLIAGAFAFAREGNGTSSRTVRLIVAALVALLVIYVGAPLLIHEGSAWRLLLDLRAPDPEAAGGRWQTVLGNAWRHFFFGLGPENYSIFADRYAVTTGPHARQWLANPHNVWLEMAVTRGVPGLLLWLAVPILAIARLWKVRGTAPGATNSWLIAGLVGFMAHALFAVRSPAGDIAVALLLANALRIEQIPRPTRPPWSVPATGIGVTAVTLAAGYLAFSAVLIPIAAARFVTRALQSKEPNEAARLMENARRLRPDYAREDLFQLNVRLIEKHQDALFLGPGMEKHLKSTIAYGGGVILPETEHASTLVALARLYALEVRSSGSVFRPQMSALLARGRKLAPGRPEWTELEQSMQARQNEVEAERVRSEKAHKMRPGPATLLDSATALYRLRHETEAYAAAREALLKAPPERKLHELLWVFEAAERRADLPVLIRLYEAGRAKDPRNRRYVEKLVDLYAQTSSPRLPEARTALEKMRKEAPPRK